MGAANSEGIATRPRPAAVLRSRCAMEGGRVAMCARDGLPHDCGCAKGPRTMARAPRRSIHLVVGEARRELAMTQAQFGEAVGASHRSAVRWDAGQATPAVHQLCSLARLLYPRNRALAAEGADAADGETLESLGLEAPAPPLPPPPPPPPPPPAAASPR